MIVIDGSHMLHRNLHAMEDLHDQAGNSTGGAFGVLNSIHKSLKLRKYKEPCIVLWDSGIPTFRRELYTEYKPKKVPVQEEGLDISKFYSDINKNPVELDLEDAAFLRKYQFNRDLLNLKLLPALGIPSIQVPNTEADDLIALFVTIVRNEHNTIITADRDMLQLVDDNTDWYDPIRDNLVDKHSFIQEWELNPSHYKKNFVMWKAINGDGSDNIPGIEGIGGKSASKLARQLADGIPFEELERPARCNARGFENFQNSKEQILRNCKLVDLEYSISNEEYRKKLIQGFKSVATVTADEYLANDILKSYSMVTSLGIVPYVIQAQDNLDYFDLLKFFK